MKSEASSEPFTAAIRRRMPSQGRRNLRTLSNASTIGDLAGGLAKARRPSDASDTSSASSTKAPRRNSKEQLHVRQDRPLHTNAKPLSPKHRKNKSSISIKLKTSSMSANRKVDTKTGGITRNKLSSVRSGVSLKKVRNGSDSSGLSVSTTSPKNSLRDSLSQTMPASMSPSTSISNAFTGLHLDLPSDGNFLKNQKFGLAQNNGTVPSPTNSFDVSGRGQSHIRMHSGAHSPFHGQAAFYDPDIAPGFPSVQPLSPLSSLPLSMMSSRQPAMHTTAEPPDSHQHRKAKAKASKRNRPGSMGRRSSPIHKRGAATDPESRTKGGGHVSQRSMPKAFERPNILLSPTNRKSNSISSVSPNGVDDNATNSNASSHNNVGLGGLGLANVGPLPGTQHTFQSASANLLGGCVMSSLLPSPLVSPLVSPTNSPTNNSNHNDAPHTFSVQLPSPHAHSDRGLSLSPKAHFNNSVLPTVLPDHRLPAFPQAGQLPLTSQHRQSASLSLPAPQPYRTASPSTSISTNSRARTPSSRTSGNEALTSGRSNKGGEASRSRRRTKNAPANQHQPPTPEITSANGRRRKAIPWTEEEDTRLLDMVKQHGPQNWRTIAEYVGSRTPAQVAQRWRKILNPDLLKVNKGKWTVEEDNRLRYMIKKHGLNDWHTIAEGFSGTRTVKHCRERWLKHISPELKRNEPWTLEEDSILLKVRKQLGYNGWAEIAKALPGRTDNAVKRRYRSLTNPRAYSPPSQSAATATLGLVSTR